MTQVEPERLETGPDLPRHDDVLAVPDRLEAGDLDRRRILVLERNGGIASGKSDHRHTEIWTYPDGHRIADSTPEKVLATPNYAPPRVILAGSSTPCPLRHGHEYIARSIDGHVHGALAGRRVATGSPQHLPSLV